MWYRKLNAHNILTCAKKCDIIQALSRTKAGFARGCIFGFKEEKAMYRVLKRDGVTVDFDISKISGAMIKAFDALGKTEAFYWQ